jgi:hypothetical protein
MKWLQAVTDTPSLLESCIKHLLVRFGNSPKDSFIGLQNMLRTVEQIRTTPGVNLLKDSFKGKPCVIALTGPSLNKQLPLLKKQRCLIIAPDVSASILEANGINAHFVCAVERGECTTEEVRGKHKAHLVLMPVVPKSTYDEYDGPKIVAFKKIDHFGLIPWDRGLLHNPGIVGNMCFSLATYLGCSPIVLIGADHSFAGAQIHANGMKNQEEAAVQMRDERIRVKIPGYYGADEEHRVETAEPYLSALMSISDEARHHVVWNCTEGGANIPNCTNKPFSEVLFQEKGDIWWAIQKKLNKFVPGEKELLYANKARAIWGISKIINACNDGLNGKATLEDVCLADPPAFQILVMHIIQSFHVPFMMKPGDTGFWFLAVRDCCRRIKDELEQCTCDS